MGYEDVWKWAMEGEEFDCIYKYITAVLDCNENLGVTSFPFLETWGTDYTVS